MNQKDSIPGTVFVIDISNELVMFTDELLDKDKNKPNLDKDVIVTFFHYLVRVVFNSNNYDEVRYETPADAINTIDDTVGLILRDVNDIPKLENDTLVSKLTVIQSKLTLDSTAIINAISKSIVSKIYTKFQLEDKVIELVREVDIVLLEIVINFGYAWQSGQYNKKAVIKLNIN